MWQAYAMTESQTPRSEADAAKNAGSRMVD
jgi:hypothetical protein